VRLIAATLAALAAAATLGTADAVPPPGFTLTVTKAGTAAGTVVTTPAGIDCGADCTAVFPSGTSVTLKAVEGYRARFAGWSGDCSGTTSCVLSMTGDHAVQARFNALGPPGCKVPRVLGLSVAKAKVKLVLANCRLGKVGHRASTRKLKGKVVAQRPRPGTKLKKGGKDNLTLGTGPKAGR
jgi:hypothetical protein